MLSDDQELAGDSYIGFVLDDILGQPLEFCLPVGIGKHGLVRG
jgi:hypothetical protein